jgi:glutaryl-CoA dehydrogenase
MAKLNPFDLYDIQSLLSEEELMIKDSVARFVDERALPLIAKHFDDCWCYSLRGVVLIGVD